MSTLPLRLRPTGPLYPISSPAVYCKMYLTLIRRRYEALALSHTNFFRSGNRTLQFNVKLKRGYFKMKYLNPTRWDIRICHQCKHWYPRTYKNMSVSFFKRKKKHQITFDITHDIIKISYHTFHQEKLHVFTAGSW